MSFNRKFNPNIWEQPRPSHQIPPFVNNQQNFFQNQNQGNFQYQNTNFNSNFQQNQNIRPLLGLPVLNVQDLGTQQFRNYNNNHNQDNYRRPGPACARNNNYGNNNQKWIKNNRQDDFKNAKMRKNDTFENHNNNFNNNRSRPPSNNNDQQPPSGSDQQKFSSLVEHLKAVQNSKKSDGETSKKEIDAMCAKNASEASKKLMTQIKTMDKDSVMELINNPKQPYKKKVLNIQAREKLREQMRKKLKKLGDESDANDFNFEPDECIDYEKVPETLIAQIGRTMDLEDMDLSESIHEGSIVGSIEEDKDIEVVTKNLGNDFLMGSEMLLMNGFSLLAETDETDIDNVVKPPLPKGRPPSPPPEPVPPPSNEMVVQPAFSSVEKPWSPIPKRHERLNDDWGIESARNPDPPGFDTHDSILKSVIESDGAPAMKPEPLPQQSVELKQSKPVIETDDEWDKVSDTSFIETAIEAPENHKAPELGQRANETYGNYKRRIAEEQKSKEVDVFSADVPQNNNLQEIASSSSANVHQNNIPQRSSGNQSDQRISNNQRNFNDRFNKKNDRNDWAANRKPNQNPRQDQTRKSRFDTDRGRDQNVGNSQKRNLSRDTNNSHDSGGRFDEVKDVHNYRFQNERTSMEPNIDHLNSLLNPKPLQFKGSFNKRMQNSGNFNQSWNNRPRSRSKNRTPVNNSMERDFDESLLPSPNDVRPCLTTLKKVMDIDAELMRIHDKIHGIDKVISNLQSERIAYQKTCADLQHDRKVLFENLMKRAMSSTDDNDTPPKESIQPRERSQQGSCSKSAVEKKLQNIVDQKKRKHEEQHEESKKKKMDVIETTTSAAAKAAKIQKEREEEERRVRIVEKRRLKKLRREREENERLRLEQKNRQEAAASTTIKVEPADKSIKVEPCDKSKSSKASSGKTSKSVKSKEQINIIFMRNEMLQTEGVKMKNFSVKLLNVKVTDEFVETFKSAGSVEVDMIEWIKWCSKEVKLEKIDDNLEKKKDKASSSPPKSKTPEVTEDPLAITESNEDPLAFDETLVINPPTPGSNLIDNNEDSMLIEIPTEQDYSEWTGNFASHEHPIVHLQTILNKFIVCATEGGKILKYRICDGKLAAVFSKHKEICNSFVYDSSGSIYTVSSDGFLHKIKFKTFQLSSSENFNEPLQVIEKSKAGIYVGTKSGKIFKLKNDLTEREEEPICELGVLILCMRATKEGSRNILLVSSRTHAIQVRDASDGLLLRTLSDNLAGVSIYDMLIEGSTIYCGSNRHEIFAVDFTTGALKKSLPCGAGAICVKLFKNYLIAACYDGNIYIFNTKNNEAAVNICGPSNMLLAMDLWNDKIIASTKDKTLKIMNIPT